MKENYQLIMEQTLARLQSDGKKHTLLLHSCCAPCSSYVLQCLIPAFEIEVFYCNPNIHPAQEYEHRLAEQRRLLAEMTAGTVRLRPAEYEPEAFFSAVKGLEGEPEGGARCEACFRLRLERTAQAAREAGAEYFGTTLTVSPHKNAETINRIGQEIEQRCGVKFLLSDFKKREGYKQSIALSRQYGLYRQNYCGCVFSLRDGEKT